MSGSTRVLIVDHERFSALRRQVSRVVAEKCVTEVDCFALLAG